MSMPTCCTFGIKPVTVYVMHFSICQRQQAALFSWSTLMNCTFPSGQWQMMTTSKIAALFITPTQEQASFLTEENKRHVKNNVQAVAR